MGDKPDKFPVSLYWKWASIKETHWCYYTVTKCELRPRLVFSDWAVLNLGLRIRIHGSWQFYHHECSFSWSGMWIWRVACSCRVCTCVFDVMNPSWDHCFLHHCCQWRMWNKSMWQWVFFFLNYPGTDGGRWTHSSYSKPHVLCIRIHHVSAN